MKTATKPAKKSLLSHYKKMGGGGRDNSLLTDANGNVLPDTGSADWDTFGQKKPGISSDAVNAAAGVLDTGVNLLSPKDKYGVQSNAGSIAGGAIKDAALGFSVAGPIGAGVGAIVGGVTGLLGNKKAQKAKNISIHNQGVQEQQERDARSGAIIAANPSLKYGNLQASYYAMGGTMKGTIPQVPRLKKPMTPVQPKQRVMPPIADVPGRQLSRMAKGGSMHPQYDVAKQTKPYRTYMPRVPTQNLSKMGSGGEAFKTTDPSYKYPWMVMGANGGKLESMSTGNTKVEGPSHANGGVKFPAQGVELEGDETLNGDFVFSKKLGFAQTHEKIAKAQGRVEKKPDTVVNRNTLKALDRQTDMLKQQQEATKQAMGIPNEMDKGTMANGGKLYKRMDLGGDGGPGDPKAKKTAPKEPKEPPLITVHADGHIGPWGNDIKPGAAIPLPAISPTPPISDKTAGLSSNYYSPGSIPVKPAIATIPKSPNFYRNGGKLMRKMADGGYDDMEPDTTKAAKPKLKNINGDWQWSADNLTRDLTSAGSAISNLWNKLPSVQEYNANNKRTTTPAIPGRVPVVAPSVVPTPAHIATRTPPGAATRALSNKPTATGGTKAKTVSATGAPVSSDPRFPLPSVTDTGLPALPELDGMPANLQLDNAPTKTSGTVANGSLSSSSLGSGSSSKSGAVAPKGRLIDKINTVGGTLTPFLPNLYEATRKLPLPPTPSLESEIAPALVDYSASRNEAVRQTRGANKAAEQNLNTGAAVAATRAANLAGQERAVASINEAEGTANAGIRNQTNQVNLQVRARNNSLRNQYQQELTERQLKGQELTGQNLASISEKIQGIKRDNKAEGLDEQRLMIEALKDNTGASYRGIKSIFAKHLTKEDMSSLDDHFQNLSKQDKADREAQSSVDKTLAENAKKARPLSDNYKSTKDFLGNTSSIITPKEQRELNQGAPKRETVR